MKAKELKKWVSQFSDSEEIVITAMSDDFMCGNFELHSPYENGEQAQEIILPYYLDGVTNEQPIDESHSVSEPLIWLSEYADAHGLIFTVNGNDITIDDYCYVQNYAYDFNSFDINSFKPYINGICNNVERAMKQIHSRVIVLPDPINCDYINMAFSVDKTDDNLKDKVISLMNKWRELINIEIKHATLKNAIKRITKVE